MSESRAQEIVIQNLQMQVPFGNQSFAEKVLEGEIDDLEVEHVAYASETEHAIMLSNNHVSMFLFLKGNGTLKTDSITQKVVPESVAIPSNDLANFQIEVSEGEALHILKLTKKLSLQDVEDFKNFPEENKYSLFYKRFKDCEPYTEKIKSPGTVSRTVLPADIVPRISLGTVETTGPDEVGAHEHPMLEQLFLGLADNDITVYADEAQTNFKAFSLLHIPLGSRHWVSVDARKKMNYMWMDFFLTKAGEAWLKTHKPINP